MRQVGSQPLAPTGDVKREPLPGLLDGRVLLQASSVVVARLLEQRVELEGGGVTWRGEAARAAIPGGSRGPDGVHDLYSGVPGVALFLAAHARVTGEASSRDWALRAMEPLRQEVRRALQGEAGALPPLAVGGLVGLGSLLYAWIKLGQLLEEPALAEEAHALASLLTPERLAEDREYDVGQGSAGALLGLLSLEAAADRPGPEGMTPTARARLAAEHLLRQRTSHEGGPQAWTSASAAAPRSGMAHGVAGICLALARQWRRDRDPRWLEAIGEGLRLERGLYDEASGNWISSSAGKPQRLIGWCYGAPGIALSRMGLLEAGIEGPAAALAREDLTAALKTMSAPGSYPLDHLCCGSMARAEALLRAWQFTGEGPLLQVAHSVALRVLRAAKTRGGFHLGTGEGTEPSLFQGLAGVGYSLLRLAEPAALPCLLLFE